ncbi:MAG: hypothetical protein DLM58_20940 [Pseudonocardiales bacterium]|nr:MAG: hypothetical protein DLM58_20940 [Pseudonocardiales bacterium]
MALAAAVLDPGLVSTCPLLPWPLTLEVQLATSAAAANAASAEPKRRTRGDMRNLFSVDLNNAERQAPCATDSRSGR